MAQSLFKIIAVSYFSLASFVHAQSLLTAESVFVLTPKDYQHFIEDKKEWAGQHEFEIDNQRFVKPYKTKLSGIRMGVGYTVNLSKRRPGRQVYPFTAVVTDPEIIIGRIETNDSVFEQRGNVQIEVKVRASCQNVKVTSANSKINLSGNIEMYTQGGLVKLKLRDLKMQQLSEGWSVDTGSCAGVKGYDAEVAKYISKNLATNSSIEGAIRDMVNAQLLSQADEVNRSLLSRTPIEIDKTMSAEMVPRFVEMTKSGNLLIRNHLDLVIAKPVRRGKVFQKLNVGTRFLNSRVDSQLILPRQFLQGFVNITYANRLWRQRVQTREDKDLRELLDNKSALFFVWPDLMNYNSKSNFKIDLFPTSRPVVQSIAQSGVGASMSLKGNLRVEMLAPKGGRHIPYVNFTSLGSSFPLFMDITKSGLAMSFARPSVNFKKSWDRNYVRRYDPNTHIDIEFLSGKLKDSIATKQKIFKIGALKLGQKKEIKVFRIEVGNVSFRMIFNERGSTRSQSPRR